MGEYIAHRRYRFGKSIREIDFNERFTRSGSLSFLRADILDLSKVSGTEEFFQERVTNAFDVEKKLKTFEIKV